MTQSFGTARLQPDGAWVQTTPLLAVAGTSFRGADVRGFADAVRLAERQGRPYGIELEREHGNPHDSSAIKVVGFAQVKRLLRGERREVMHLGYVPADVAAEIVEAVVDPGHAHAAELYDLFEGEDAVSIRFFILVPANSPVKDWRARRVAATALDPQTLTREQKEHIRKQSLGLYRNTRLEQAEAMKKVGDFPSALDFYLRVCWLDAQGANNVGLIDDKPSSFGKPFEDADRFLAPGIVKAVAQAANSLVVDPETLRERALAVGTGERALLAKLKPPLDEEAAWAMFASAVSEMMATGTKWRAKK